jgi:hypothetical protein
MKVILKIIQRHIEERSLLNARQFGFCACHSMIHQFMRLIDHVTLNFNSNMSTAVLFLDIEKAVHKTWHLGLIYKLFNLKFSVSLFNLIFSFLSQIKFRVSVKDEMSMPRDMQSKGATRFHPVPHIVQFTYIQSKHLVSIYGSLLMTPVYNRL